MSALERQRLAHPDVFAEEFAKERGEVLYGCLWCVAMFSGIVGAVAWAVFG